MIACDVSWGDTYMHTMGVAVCLWLQLQLSPERMRAVIVDVFARGKAIPVGHDSDSARLVASGAVPKEGEG